MTEKLKVPKTLTDVNLGQALMALGPAGAILYAGITWAAEMEIQVEANSDNVDQILALLMQRDANLLARERERLVSEQKDSAALSTLIDRIEDLMEEQRRGAQ